MLIDTTKGYNKCVALDNELKQIMATIKHKIDNKNNTCNKVIVARLKQIKFEMQMIELEYNQNPINN